mmetsp:Transcript_19566/g.42783  ORF Transcript_19566/g.42783 Transcript_19566/m.42783 type:complete len:451 (+) Transcript_19566:29-1381(+)
MSPDDVSQPAGLLYDGPMVPIAVAPPVSRRPPSVSSSPSPVAPRRAQRRGLDGDPSPAASALVDRLRRGDVGPVLSLRTTLNNCRSADVRAILEVLAESKTVQMLSFGRNDALANSFELVDLLIAALRRGFVWACDWGELAFRADVLDRLVEGLERPPEGGEADIPGTNVAFAFLDVGCGASPEHVARVKQITHKRRTLDKAIPAECISRTQAPWLDSARNFGWVMRSENLTRCFWRPYQEPTFWRRAGFDCPKVPRPEDAPRRWVNPAMRPLAQAFHRGDLSAEALASAFPTTDDDERSAALLRLCLEKAQTLVPRAPSARSKRPAPSWLGCDGCPRWHKVDPVTFSRWRQQLFLCKDIGEVCNSKAALRSRPPDEDAVASAEEAEPEDEGVVNWLGCDTCKQWHVVDEATYQIWEHKQVVTCGNLGQMCRPKRQRTKAPAQGSRHMLL